MREISLTKTAFGVDATVTFTEGNDFYVFATIGDDVIAGLAGDDIMIGGTGTDLIDGGSGSDMAVMQASFADSTFSLDSEGRLIISSGVGSFLSFKHTLANVERVQFLVLDEYEIGDLLALAGGSEPPPGKTLTGTNGPDQLFGTSGDDLIRPRFGADIVRGGPGEDTLELPTTLKQTGVFETTPTELAFRGNLGTQSFAYTVEGVERFVFSDGATYTFAEMVELANNNTGEPLPDPTQGADQLAGTGAADILKGLGGNDVLRGLGGPDTLMGGAGNDKLLGGLGNDRLLGGPGNDQLLGGTGQDQLLGAAGNDRLVGEAGNDRLLGAGGNDTLLGGAGNDRLIGGGGRDMLTGGRGVDTMSGNAGADIFVFDDQDTGLKAGRRDVITDFGGADIINLRRLDADRSIAGDQSFEFSGTSAAAHGVWYSVRQGNATVWGDTNGDGKADFAITLNDVTRLFAGDFVL
ncbi:MAG TPA: hypothetical protein DC061_11660 [Gemmobacter sp.]|nr:hypothetical protein [Gemmobacter sp.]